MGRSVHTRALLFPVLSAVVVMLIAVLLAGCRTEATAVDSPATEATAADHPIATNTTAAPGDRPVSVDEAIAQIEAACGLSPGTVLRSAQTEATLLEGDVALGWSNGDAEVNPATGRIVRIFVEPATSDAPSHPSLDDLKGTTTRLMEVLGWSEDDLHAAGFTAKESETTEHVYGLPEYLTTWTGHDEAGLANGGIIQISLDAVTGELWSFFFHQGPRAAADSSQTISQDEAVRIAVEAIGPNPPVGGVTTTVTLPGGVTTTGPELGLKLKSAELRHIDAPGITGGKNMLVWVVKMEGWVPGGHSHPTVYLDAVSGKVLDQAF